MPRSSFEREPFTSLNAVTATGAGDEVGFVARPGYGVPTDFTWTVEDTGSPTSKAVDLEGCIGDPDVAANWFVVDTTTGNGMRHVVNKMVRFLRANLTSLVGGTSPTVTAIIMAK